MRGLALLLALALALAPAAQAAQAASTAVAVMPFKNIGGARELDWLRVGIAETLIADLAKDGGRPVVERDQLDRALAEVMLQAQNASEDSMAAQAGKLVGAATVVVGAFQAAPAGGELRITARFVDVESGVVKETAKVTGKIDDVFALQDQIVAKLLQRPTKKTRPKAKQPKKQIEAYELYALSLSTTSEAERVRYLRDSVAVDPEFEYAVDALRALEKKIQDFRRDAVVSDRLQGDAAIQAARRKDGTVDERSQRIFLAFAALVQGLRYAALLQFAQEIYAEHVPAGTYFNIHEHASNYVFMSLVALRRPDEALAAGERHIQEFPGTMTAKGVASQLEWLIRQKDETRQGLASLPAELKKIDDDEARFPRADRAMFGYRRCAAYRSARDFKSAIERCGAWAKENAGRPDQLDLVARMLTMLSFAELGRFDDARTMASALIADDAAWSREHSITSMVETWPR